MLTGKKIVILSGLLGVSLALGVFLQHENTLDSFDEYTGPIFVLEYDELPYSENRVNREAKEKDGVKGPVFLCRGLRVKHPLQAATLGVGLLNDYIRGRDHEALNYAENVVAGILERDSILVPAVFAEEGGADRARLYHYDFKFLLHNNGRHPMNPPWYSSMAQGMALNFFTRLYEITKNPKYETLAVETFNSLLLFRGRSSPWISTVENNELWFEEYPEEPPNHVLNGFIFTIFGLYDYWRVFKTPLSDSLLRGAVNTLEKRVNDFRMPGAYNHYCLGHRHPSGEKYHRIHIDTLLKMNRITGLSTFAAAAKDFESDLSAVNKAESYKLDR